MFESRISRADARRIARSAGSRDLAVVESFLAHSHDEEDALATIKALKANQPHLFGKPSFRRLPRR